MSAIAARECARIRGRGARVERLVEETVKVGEGVERLGEEGERHVCVASSGEVAIRLCGRV